MTRDAQRAAGVVLLRPATPRGFEVFLKRRPEGAAAASQSYGFPGCILEKADCAEAMLDQVKGLTAQRAQKIIGAEFAPRQALGLWIAAIRGLLEETGILLAVSATGEKQFLDLAFDESRAESHSPMRDKAPSFQALLASKKIFCDLSALAHFSRWQTPGQQTASCDTHFFVACLPPDQSTQSLSQRVIHGLWLSPDRALLQFRRDELPLAFPTFASLRTLADFETLESVWKEYSPTA